MVTIALERFTAVFFYDFKGDSMVYLKPLYSSLDRLAQRQGSPFSTEARK